MKNLTLPIIRMNFVEKIGKTAIELAENITVFANGDVTNSNALLCNIVVNEVGDKFVATSDSKQVDDKNKPIFLKGDTVIRQKQSMEFKSLAGNNQAAQFAQAANAFGLQLVVQM